MQEDPASFDAGAVTIPERINRDAEVHEALTRKLRARLQRLKEELLNAQGGAPERQGVSPAP